MNGLSQTDYAEAVQAFMERDDTNSFSLRTGAPGPSVAPAQVAFDMGGQDPQAMDLLNGNNKFGTQAPMMSPTGMG